MKIIMIWGMIFTYEGWCSHIYFPSCRNWPILRDDIHTVTWDSMFNTRALSSPPFLRLIILFDKYNFSPGLEFILLIKPDVIGYFISLHFASRKSISQSFSLEISCRWGWPRPQDKYGMKKTNMINLDVFVAPWTVSVLLILAAASPELVIALLSLSRHFKVKSLN